MYLLRLPNSVYYTRIATPLSLYESGYPKEFKFSLLTRERKTAYLRTIEQVQLLHGLFEKSIKLSLCFVDFLPMRLMHYVRIIENNQKPKLANHRSVQQLESARQKAASTV